MTSKNDLTLMVAPLPATQTSHSVARPGSLPREVRGTRPRSSGNGRQASAGDQDVICLSLFEGFELSRNGQPVDLPLTSQRLLAFLALHGRPLLRSFVAGSLYLDKTEERACANLRSALWRTRQPGIELVWIRGNLLSLVRGIAVDVQNAIERARVLLDPGSEVVDADLDEAALIGDLLPDWYDDWVLVERERLRQLRLNALESLSMRLRERRLFARAIDVAIMATTSEPLRESSHRVLIQAHLAEGNIAEAIRQYQLYASILRDELGYEPSRHMRQLIPAAIRESPFVGQTAPEIARMRRVTPVERRGDAARES